MTDDRDDYCECQARNPELHETGEPCTARSFGGLICSRPRGHDGPHASCIVEPGRHPATVFNKDHTDVFVLRDGDGEQIPMARFATQQHAEQHAAWMRRVADHDEVRVVKTIEIAGETL